MNRPILFSGPMIRALLDGRKTQTRRMVTPQPDSGAAGRMVHLGASDWALMDGDLTGEWRCPYGQPGDLLWVRETWAEVDYLDNSDGMLVDRTANVYRADGDNQIDRSSGERWTPSIHMPRWASRLTLRITDVRVERLLDISREDAIAEGIERIGGDTSVSPWRNYLFAPCGEMRMHCASPVMSYMTLWNSINGPGSSFDDPFVWALTFEVIHKNVDHVLSA